MVFKKCHGVLKLMALLFFDKNDSLKIIIFDVLDD